MKFSRSIVAIDSHTMGEPTRVIVGGVPSIKGATMPEKKKYLEDHMDYIRTSIMHEPRGHNDMFGSIITQPTSDKADIGIIFMDGGGYLNMCGHGSIGAATVVVENGMVPMVEPVTEINLEAPAGIVKAKVFVECGKVKEVSITNVPAFLYKRDVKINVPEIGEIILDISFGGSFFAILNAKQLGLEIIPANADKLKNIGMVIRDVVNKEIKVQHPTLPHINTVDLVEIYDEPTNPEATYKNVVVFGDGQVDRSPCGTGTSAKMATLYAKGKLKLGEPFVYESIIGTLFRGRVLETTKVGDLDAIVPEITGSAYITGYSNYVIDDSDPVRHGFMLQ
ncbi:MULTISPECIES: proline racemase [unclassified Sedimentibacter]|uniref:proline racemase n=1 Tax=unclassified Sedimentibacter TaxID=2649220 RepID=UPI0027DF682E|nr:proline racemase [Sedimentibacter sp. MB35-C1]WMJ78174.1 proline racemase [Sedimentibacter sp. MB35-C1]